MSLTTDLPQSWQSRRESLAGGTLPWLRTLREDAIARFEAVGIPTPRDEDFKYTSLAALAKTDLRVAAPAAAPSLPALPDLGQRVVFVDGHFAPEHSTLSTEGLRVVPLSRAIVDDPALLEGRIGTIAALDADPFNALNLAFAEDGAVIVIERGAVLRDPLHVVFVATQGGTSNHPRNLIVAGDNSEAVIVEHFVGATSEPYLTNAVTEVDLGDNAAITHYRIQEEGRAGFHLAQLQVREGRDARFATHSFAFGGRVARVRIGATVAQGASVEMRGLYLAGKGQTHDHHTLVDHAEPHGRSVEVFKGILDEGGRGVFTGKVLVRENAQQIDSSQSVRNLLLADDAIANARPQLEILADDVKCAHGAAIGHLDEEALFYLRTRGLPVHEAEKLLTYAFASELVASVHHDAVREALEALVHDWLGRLDQRSH